MILASIVKLLVRLWGVGPVLLAVSLSIPAEDLKAEYHFYCDDTGM